MAQYHCLYLQQQLQQFDLLEIFAYFHVMQLYNSTPLHVKGKFWTLCLY